MTDEITTPASPTIGAKLDNIGMMAIGFALTPFVFLFAPRFVIGTFREGMEGTLADADQRHRIRFDSIDKTEGDLRDDEALRIVEDLIEDGDWTTLSELVGDWDMACEKATNGYPLANSALDRVIHEFAEGYYLENYCTPIQIPVISDATIEMFDLLRAKNPEHYFLTLVTARMQVMKAWEFRGTDTSDTVSESGWEGAQRRAEKAKWLITPLIDKGSQSPLLAFLRISLLAFDCSSTADFRRPFDAHAAADPTSWLGYRWLGYYLLERWYGGDDFEAAIREETGRMPPETGAAAYASAYLNVASIEDNVLLGIDPDYFARGVEELIRMHGSDQGYVNWIMRQVYQLPEEQAPFWIGARQRAWAIKQAAIRQVAYDIVSKHLKTIHRGVFPSIADALYILTKAAQDDYRAGHSFTLDAKGFRSAPPE